MLNKIDDPMVKIVLSVLLFPMLFQTSFVSFAWGLETDLWWIVALKRLLILLPTLAIIFGCWASIACILTVPFRHKRMEFLSAVLVTWWDLGRAIFSFWGGILRFLFYTIGWIFNLIRMIVIGLWLIVQDVLLSPFRMARDIGEGYFKPGTPWLAVLMTVLWACLEALIFTFVMTPLVTDVLAGMASGELAESKIQIPLYFMLLAFILGSYAVMSSLKGAIAERNIGTIALVAVIEILVAGFEIVFLYREFVDALVPWFAQHSGGNFQLGIFGILFIATFAWLGIRGMTWFLFGSSGTPIIMAIIQRKGLQGGPKTESKGRSREENFAFIYAAIERVKKDIGWIHDRGNDLLGSFILPPLQIVAAATNFCTLFFFANHLFELPFADIKDLITSKVLLMKVKKTAASNE